MSLVRVCSRLAPVRSFQTTAVMLIASLLLLLPFRAFALSVTYDWNRDVPTKTNPPVKTTIKLDTDMRLDMVRVYHLAPKQPMTVTLKGKAGSYQIKGFKKVEAFGPKKELQVWRADSLGIVVKAGEYQAVSSDPATWLFNNGTGNRGFLVIDGTRLQKGSDTSLATGTTIEGEWSVDINKHRGTMTFTRTGNSWTGRLNLGSSDEAITDIQLNTATGSITFVRPRANQHFTGTWKGSSMNGRFDKTYNWSATRK